MGFDPVGQGVRQDRAWCRRGRTCNARQILQNGHRAHQQYESDALRAARLEGRSARSRNDTASGAKLDAPWWRNWCGCGASGISGAETMTLKSELDKLAKTIRERAAEKDTPFAEAVDALK